MVLHFVRSIRTVSVWDQLVRRSFQDGSLSEVALLLTNPAHQENLARASFGLVPAGSEMMQLVRERIVNEFVDPLLVGGDIFVSHVIEVLAKCQDFVTGANVWLGFVPSDCDLVIGDCPVITPTKETPANHQLQGALQNAIGMIMPLSSKVVAGLGVTDHPVMELTPSQVSQLNRWQCIASSEIICRPGGPSDISILTDW